MMDVNSKIKDFKTKDSKIKDIYANPLGKDVIDKILMQMGMESRVVTNPLVSNLKLRHLNRMFKNKVGAGFYEDFIKIISSEDQAPFKGTSKATPTWWKEAVFYQIYPSSFNDSNNDGVGDIPGITEKLDVLKNLGVDAIWLSPVYDSPWDDNGYDIRDYKKIAERFGTMEDMEKLIFETHKRGMKIIMDLVVNHTSDEHPWFVEALGDKESPKRDYYFIRKGKNGGPPNNWKSFFSGPAWKKVGEDEYALHLFSEKQMDLNWDNEEVRKEVEDIVKWWMEKGIDGFRLDVINYISKREGLPDGNEFIGNLMKFTGIEHYFYGPNLHKYLYQLRTNAFEPYGGFSVGETPGIGEETGKLLTQADRKELDLIFNFDHLETPGHMRSDDYIYDLEYLKKYYTRYQKNLTGQDWMSLYTDNHDNPRMISKIDPEGIYRKELSKVILTMLLTLKGTPFIYQGQEIGRINRQFTDINDIRDVESLNLYKEYIDEGKTPEEAFGLILPGTRDHARIPMAWDDSKHGGFTEGTPWIEQDPLFEFINVKTEVEDPESVWVFTKNLIRLRKEHNVLIYGDVVFHNETKKSWFSWERTDGKEKFLIEINLSSKEVARPSFIPLSRIVLGSDSNPNIKFFKPYEVRISKLNR